MRAASPQRCREGGVASESDDLLCTSNRQGLNNNYPETGHAKQRQRKEAERITERQLPADARDAPQRSTTTTTGGSESDTNEKVIKTSGENAMNNLATTGKNSCR
jgi:hypothetical protein